MRLNTPLFLVLTLAPLAAGAATTAPTTPTAAQMEILHPLFAALHAAHAGHHHHGDRDANGAKSAGPAAIHVDSTRTMTPADGSPAKTHHIVGDLSLKPNADGKGRTVAGTVTTTDAEGTATVTLTNISKSHENGQHCMLPSSGSASVKAADGTTHAVVFTATCGQVTLDGANVTLSMPDHMHHGH